MTTPNGNLLASGLASLALLAGAPALAQDDLPDLSGWHEASQAAAQHMMETYGPPAATTDDMLIWDQTGPWKRTVIYKEATTHNFPMEHPDVMQQWIDLDVPPDYFDDLAKYDGSVVVNRTEAQISARCDKEAANFLALNLAHDIIEGERTVEEARQFYAETMQQVMDGQSPEYTTSFTFDVPQEDLSNPDEAAM